MYILIAISIIYSLYYLIKISQNKKKIFHKLSFSEDQYAAGIKNAVESTCKVNKVDFNTMNTPRETRGVSNSHRKISKKAIVSLKQG
ncbi:hypothetical protein CPAV1605_93 [seawater metagenome]|uniref:Uncharacterized protein n=1 Tax=seawater metagenome TaxID=1561972 RepID=A0A5E8CGR4_9ZZZZ